MSAHPDFALHAKFELAQTAPKGPDKSLFFTKKESMYCSWVQPIGPLLWCKPARPWQKLLPNRVFRAWAAQDVPVLQGKPLFLLKDLKACLFTKNAGASLQAQTRATRSLPMPWPSISTLLILLATVLFFIFSKQRSDIIAVCALLALMLCGVLTPQEAFSGFSNNIVITLAGVFIIGGAIVRTGLAAAASAKILQVAGTNQHVLFMLIMLVTAAIGSIVSNTGTVAIMMPVVVSMAASINESPGRFLMPLAFMSSIGGMLTLIGNTSNMVVNDVYVRAGFESLQLFSFLPVGIVSVLFGIFILAPATSFFLSRRKNEKAQATGKKRSLKELADKYHLLQNTYRIAVPDHSPIVGKTLMDLALPSKFSVIVQSIQREKGQRRPFGTSHSEMLPASAQSIVQAGDVLYCLASLSHIAELVEQCQLGLLNVLGADKNSREKEFADIGICELVLMTASRYVKQSVAESGLREQFGINLLGIQRGDQFILDDLREQSLLAGDCLLVQGSWENLARLEQSSQHWVVVGTTGNMKEERAPHGKMFFTACVLVAMVASMTLGFLPTVVAVLLAAVLLVVGGCFRNVEEAYHAINWETVIMVSCMLPLAIAMEKVGLVASASEYMLSVARVHGPYVALAVVYASVSAMNIVISATPVALLAAPVALKIAIEMNLSPLPFLFAVACASCMCFASPFSTPSNALVMSAGRYTFSDYLKIGLPLQALMGVIMILVLPLLFPFQP